MINHYPDHWIKVTHLPSGLIASEEIAYRRSWFKARERCKQRLRGMLFTRCYGPSGPVIRTYEIPDGEVTTADLETGACIDERARMAVAVVADCATTGHIDAHARTAAC